MKTTSITKALLFYVLPALAVLMSGCSDFKEISETEFSDGFRLVVLGEENWEYSRGAYYEIYRKSELVCPRTYLGDASKISKLKAIGPANGVWAFYEVSRPSKVRILFNEKKLSTWPKLQPNELREQADARANEMLSAIKAALNVNALELERE